MRERPIIMSAPMVRALLAGTKTQMRRLVKPQPTHFNPVGVPRWQARGEPSKVLACPFGQPGDRLWVREAFCDDWLTDAGGIAYRADGMDAEMFDAGCKWRPSIYMPRNLSRITLEVVSVRVERLHDISEADAIAEGVRELPGQAGEPGCWWTADASAGAPLHGRTPVHAYRALWDSLNGLGSWDANPWVWVVEFRRVGDSDA